MAPPEGELEYYAATEKGKSNAAPTPLKEWPFNEVAKAQSSAADSLESAIIDFVVQSHFEFISYHGYFEEDGMKSALQRRAELEEKKRRLQRQAFQKQVKQHTLAIAAAAIAVLLSSAINSALQKRANSRR